MIYFSDFAVAGGAGDTGLLGVLAYKGSAEAIDDTTQTITFDTEAHDAAGYHDTGTNTDRLTIPAGVSRGRYIVNLNGSSSDDNQRQLKNGASFAGRAVGYADTNITDDDASNFASAIVAVVQGDYFTTEITSLIGQTLRANSCWASFEPVGAAIKGALVSKTGTQAISAGTTTTVTFDSETYDTDAFHDNVTNNSRLTVASGVSLVRLSACIECSNVGSGEQAVLSMFKNGAGPAGGFAKDILGPGDVTRVPAVSAILAVSPGDYFEARFFTTAAETIAVASWFQIEEVPAGGVYALVGKSGTQVISAATPTLVAFGAEVADASGMHDNAVNNSRLTVPSGMTRARASFNVKTPSATGDMIARVLKNGSYIAGLPWCSGDTAGTDSLNGFGAWLDAAPGDYFELEFESEAGLTLGTDVETWFQLECA